MKSMYAENDKQLKQIDEILARKLFEIEERDIDLKAVNSKA